MANQAAAVDRWLEEHRDELVEHLREFLRIRSVGEDPAEPRNTIGPGQPFGEGVRRALDYVLALAAEAGLRTRNLDGFAGHAEYGEGPEIVGVLGHVDVVPEGEGWQHDPYGAELVDGRIYGRGAIDDKGPTLAAFYGLRAVLESGAAPRRRVRLILGGDEEREWRCMERYFAEEPQPVAGFAPDAYFPIVQAEKGILDLRLRAPWPAAPDTGGKTALLRVRAGQRANMVPDRAQALLQVTVGEEAACCARAEKLEAFLRGRGQARIAGPGRVELQLAGRSAHGSTPEEGLNAAALLLQVLAALVEGEGREGILTFLARCGLDLYGKGFGIACSDEVSGPLTSNLGLLRGEAASGELLLTYNLRYPVRIEKEWLVEALRRRVAPAGVTVEEAGGKRSLFVPAEAPLIRVLQAVYREQTGEEARLLSIGGGTYARALRTGVAFGPLFPGQVNLAHQADEYVEIEHLMRCARIYARAVQALLEAERLEVAAPS